MDIIIIDPEENRRNLKRLQRKKRHEDKLEEIERDYEEQQVI